MRHELRRQNDLRLWLGATDTRPELCSVLDRENLDRRVLREKFLYLRRLVVDLLKSCKLGFIERGDPFDPNRHDLDGMGATYGLDARFVHDCNLCSIIDLGKWHDTTG